MFCTYLTLEFRFRYSLYNLVRSKICSEEIFYKEQLEEFYEVWESCESTFWYIEP